MEFIENLFVSFFSGLVPAFMKKREKKGEEKTRVKIADNEDIQIIDTTIEGNVEISGNKRSKIKSGDLHG